MDLQEMRWGSTDWINLTQDRDRWWAVVNEVLNLQVPFNVKKFYVVPTLLLCVLYGSQNKQQLLPYKTLRDRFL
jgi:hypothetical protein